MHQYLRHIALGLGLLISAAALADARVDHFKGKPAETLPQAVANLSEYNGQLAALLSNDSLTATDMHKIHELTYTLENALEKINAELDALAENLEAVHIASEKADSATVKTKGKAYLESARQLVQ